MLSGYLPRFRNSASLKWAESWVSLFVFFIDFSGDEFYIVVEAEDAGDEQEGLGDIDQQTVRHVVDHDDLIANQCNAAHDEQHRTGVLRDFKARVFHSTFVFKDNLDNLNNLFYNVVFVVASCPCCRF